MQDSRHLVERLLVAGAYPHAVVTPIRLAETHISWVLLTGTYAYKIKKPLKLGFLDYSTLERRRLCCEEEVRINGRYASGLYLGVARICGPAASPGFDRETETLEFAVRMRQFDPRDELDALLACRSVVPDEFDALGEHVARFHAASAPVDPASDHGRAIRVRQVILDNFAELRHLPEASRWSLAIRALEQWVDAVHGRFAGLIEQRRAAGRVRECHGDLHCGNVVRWEGALTPFDGIEFDPGLRFIDVTNDVAFLTMDLAMHGRGDLRRAFLQSWTQSLGDFDGLPLLPYFETYRALVRAKVAALRALQERAGSEARSRACESAARYVDWAVECTGRKARGLVLTCGLSGSGKTWLARQLAPPLEALHIRSDVERKRLAGLAALDDSRSPPDAGIYTHEFTQRTYARLYQCARDALRGGECIVIDAAFLKRDERAHMLELACELGAPAAIVHCMAPTEVMLARLEQRARARTDASEAGTAILERQPAFWEEFGDGEQPFVVAIDTTRPNPVAAGLEGLRRLGVA